MTLSSSRICAVSIVASLSLALALPAGCSDSDSSEGTGEAAGASGASGGAGASGGGDAGSGGSSAGSGGVMAGGSSGSGAGGGAGGGAGSAGGPGACPAPYFRCLDSCDASTSSLPPADWCQASKCPAGQVTTESCGFCTNWAGSDCFTPSPHSPECRYHEGTWKLCCDAEPGC